MQLVHLLQIPQVVSSTIGKKKKRGYDKSKWRLWSPAAPGLRVFGDSKKAKKTKVGWWTPYNGNKRNAAQPQSWKQLVEGSNPTPRNRIYHSCRHLHIAWGSGRNISTPVVLMQPPMTTCDHAPDLMQHVLSSRSSVLIMHFLITLLLVRDAFASNAICFWLYNSKSSFFDHALNINAALCWLQFFFLIMLLVPWCIIFWTPFFFHLIPPF